MSWERLLTENDLRKYFGMVNWRKWYAIDRPSPDFKPGSRVNLYVDDTRTFERFTAWLTGKEVAEVATQRLYTISEIAEYCQYGYTGLVAACKRKKPSLYLFPDFFSEPVDGGQVYLYWRESSLPAWWDFANEASRNPIERPIP